MTVHEAVRKSAEELQSRVETHCRLLARATEGGDTKTEIDACPLVNSTHADSPHGDCPHLSAAAQAGRRRLRETLADVIAVLEETRKSFKSKCLEALRKKLVGVLAEDA
jgi:hypothetical protein